MAALYANWKRLRHVRLDGVNYDIGVKERQDGRFSVAWVCLACCEQGPPAPAAESFERAIAVAYFGLRTHHGLMHGNTRPNLTLQELLESPNISNDADCGASCRRQAAYEKVKAAFAELCGIPAKACNDDDQANGSKRPFKPTATECRDWSEIAFNFDEALEAYAIEVGKHAKKLSSNKTPSTHSASGRGPG